MSLKWRLIIDGPCDAYENMAKDEAIALSVKDGKSPPTLRLYQWKKLSVTLGRYQKAIEVDLKKCSVKGIPIVRRPTGGRAILHGMDLTYSFSARTDEVSGFKNLLQSYFLISTALVEAFRNLGFPVRWKNRKEKGKVLIGSPLCFQSISFGEITLHGKKVVGSAQKRWEEAFLQQGTIMLKIEAGLHEELFVGTTATDIQNTMMGLLEENPYLNIKDLHIAISEGFQKVFNVPLENSTLTPLEISLTERLIQQKYSKKEFLLQR